MIRLTAAATRRRTTATVPVGTRPGRLVPGDLGNRSPAVSPTRGATPRSWGWTGRPVGSTLRLPVGQLFDADDALLVDDDVVDARNPGREGGLIEEPTRLVDVTWSTDADAHAAVATRIDAQRALEREERKQARPVL